MQIRFLKIITCMALLGTVIVPGQRTAAQEGAVAALEEIVVTARRREETLMETPVSVTAFTADELLSRHVERAHQIAEATPNLVYRNISSSSNIGGNIFIRGIGQGDFIPTVQPGVGIYVDDAYVANISGSLTEIVDIDAIEVLRGPQGTLFGRNTIGGAILINTVKPSEEFDAYVDLKAGDFQLAQLKASVNVPFSDKFFGKFSVLSRDREGYIETPNIPAADKLPGNETTAVRVALRWQTEQVTVDWATDYFEHGSVGPPVVLEGIFEEVPTSNSYAYNTLTAPLLGLPLVDDSYALGRDSFTNLGTEWRGNQSADIVNTTLTVDWAITDNLSFNSITNFRSLESFDFRDGDATPGLIQNFEVLFDGEQFSQEFRLSGLSANDRLQWLVGLYYFEEDTAIIDIVDFPRFLITSGATVQNSSSALFGQFTYDLTDKASLTVGARSSDEELDSIVDDTNQHVRALLIPRAGGFVPFPLPPAEGAIRILPNGVYEADESRTEPYVNFAYSWTDGLMGYISYSEGFKGGGFTQRIAPGNDVFTFGPEFAEVIELGVKWSSLDNRLRVTGALFWTDYKDLQVPVSTRLGGSIENASDAEIDGGELELAAALSERWQVAVGLGHLNAAYKNVRPEVRFSADNILPSVMDWQANASIIYTAPVASGTVVARLDHNYVDEHYDNAQNLEGTLLPSWSNFNGAVTFYHSSERWEAALEGRNIADQLIIERITGNILSNGVLLPVVSPPAEWAVRFRYRF